MSQYRDSGCSSRLRIPISIKQRTENRKHKTGVMYQNLEINQNFIFK
jgi:hypothetical protein